MNHGTNSFCERWLGESWPAGALHVGGADAEGQLFSRALAENDASHISSEAWTTLNEAVAQLEAHGFAPGGRSVWAFEQATLWVARRPDGAWAGVFASSTLSDVSRATIEARLQEFTGKPAPQKPA